VHKYYLERDSEVFRDLFRVPTPPNQPVEGKTEENPIRLEGVLSTDFERFLTVLYPRIGHDDLSEPDEWASVLCVADMYAFDDVRRLAIWRLEFLASPLDKLVIGHRYGIRDFVLVGYRDLCEREQPLRSTELERLDLEDVFLLTAKREELASARRSRLSDYSYTRLDEAGRKAQRLISDTDIEKYFAARLPPGQGTPFHSPDTSHVSLPAYR